MPFEKLKFSSISNYYLPPKTYSDYPPMIEPTKPTPPPEIIYNTWNMQITNEQLNDFYNPHNGFIPIIDEGAFRFDVLGNSKTSSFITKSALFGYGQYDVEFKVTGPRKSGSLYSYCPLWLQEIDNRFDELDFIECNAAILNQFTITTYRSNYGNYLTSGNLFGSVNFEDGLYHNWSCIWNKESIKVYCDGLLQGELYPDNRYMALPPLKLCVNVTSQPSNPDPEWSLWVRSLRYNPISTGPVIIPPDDTTPTNPDGVYVETYRGYPIFRGYAGVDPNLEETQFYIVVWEGINQVFWNGYDYFNTGSESGLVNAKYWLDSQLGDVL